MTHYRYSSLLRPFSQFNLNRLEACPTSFRQLPQQPFGTMAFHRRLTAFEESHLDMTLVGEEEGPCS